MNASDTKTPRHTYFSIQITDNTSEVDVKGVPAVVINGLIDLMKGDERLAEIILLAAENFILMIYENQ